MQREKREAGGTYSSIRIDISAFCQHVKSERWYLLLPNVSVTLYFGDVYSFSDNTYFTYVV